MLKLIGKYANSSIAREAKAYWNGYEQEATVKFYQDGKYLADADYFTDEKDDAVDTAKAFCQID